MNKIILISILVLSFSFNLYGGKHHLSFKVGIGYSGAYSELDKKSTTYQLGEVALLFYRLDFDNNLGFNLGIGWNNKSFNAVNAVNGSNDIILKHIEII
jgi:hypothetical protein